MINYCVAPGHLPAQAQNWTSIPRESQVVEYVATCRSNYALTLNHEDDTFIVSALRLYCSGVYHDIQYELFFAGSGITVPLPYPGCEPLRTGEPSCGEALMVFATMFIGAAPGEVEPTQTTCASTMKNYEKCNAVCAADQVFAGYIQCYNGTLMGESLCGNPSTFSQKDVHFMRSAFSFLASGDALTLDLVKQGLSSALGVSTSEVTAFWQRVLVPHVDRRLYVDRRLHEDDMYNYTVNYDARVQDSSDPDATALALADRARKVGAVGSQEQFLISAVLRGGGVTLENPPGIFFAAEPRMVTQPFFVDSAGQEVHVETTAERAPQIIPGQAPGASPGTSGGSSSSKNDDTNNTTLVLGMVGGLFAVSVIVGCCYFGASRQRATSAENTRV